MDSARPHRRAPNRAISPPLLFTFDLGPPRVGSGSLFYGTLMGELKHECGVAAVYHAADRALPSSLAPLVGDGRSAARLVPRMLLDMQNRGQLAAGMTGYNPDR